MNVDESSGMADRSLRHRFVVDVHALVLREARILLGQRWNTGFADGLWHLPAGHMEADESLLDALVRETREELGIVVDPPSASLVHVMHHAAGRLAFFFAVPVWQGQVRNQEPEKCRALNWYKHDELPSDTVDYARKAISDWIDGRLFSLYGWDAGSGFGPRNRDSER